ncbi:MAG: CpsD/CapB family tyrosine-protein kinase [Acholeplasmataceae bacterium]
MTKNLFKRERLTSYDYLITREQPFSFVSEAFQKTLVNLEFVNVDGNLNVLQFTSSLAGAGKTTFISNIIYLLGQKNKKVVVIDLDLRKPRINRVFNAPNTNGVTDYLAGKINYETLVNYSDKLKVNYIVAGERTLSVVNVLEANKLKELIKKLKSEFDYVLVDSPPVIAVSDALYIAKLVDGVIFVVGQNEAKKTIINEAVSILRQNKVNIIGSVFTQVNVKDSEVLAYTYGYGYRYGYDDLNNKKKTND